MVIPVGEGGWSVACGGGAREEGWVKGWEVGWKGGWGKTTEGIKS